MSYDYDYELIITLSKAIEEFYKIDTELKPELIIFTENRIIPVIIGFHYIKLLEAAEGDYYLLKKINSDGTESYYSLKSIIGFKIHYNSKCGD